MRDAGALQGNTSRQSLHCQQKAREQLSLRLLSTVTMEQSAAVDCYHGNRLQGTGTREGSQRRAVGKPELLVPPLIGGGGERRLVGLDAVDTHERHAVT